MFSGSYEQVLDDKLRLVLPRKFRDAFGTTVVATLSFDNAIALYTQQAYQAKAENLSKLSDFDANARKLKRIFFATSFELSIDTHGRILLPRVLLTAAGIQKNVGIMGLDDHLEVWDAEKMAKDLSDGEENYSWLAENMMNRDVSAK